MTHELVTLESEALRLVLSPALGARAVSLFDRRTGREWLVSSPPVDAGMSQRWSSADAVFDAGAATGWDECLPSVAPASDPTGISGRLRDHGDVWGRPATVLVEGQSLTSITSGVHWPYHFERRVSVKNDQVEATYRISNDGLSQLPFLWSMHPLLDLPPDSRLHIPGTNSVAVTHMAGLRVRGLRDMLRSPTAADIFRLPSDGLAWPVGELTDGPFELDRTRDRAAGIALKLYAAAPRGGRAAAETPDGQWLGLAWDTARIPFVGLWLDYGGWPEASPVQQVAIEPTSAPADDLPAAMRLGRAIELPPGGRFEWEVTAHVGLGGTTLGEFLGPPG
ncbi:hypothetical protein BH24CHL6_BH24CHL6_03710 [soil metagenome]